MLLGGTCVRVLDCTRLADDETWSRRSCVAMRAEVLSKADRHRRRMLFSPPTCEALHERGLVHARRIGESGEGEAELVRWHLTLPLINAFTNYCRRPERNPVPHGSVIID
jgi:hypothetical protein